ncbi:MAG: hypothetical protein QXJ28_03400 [Candidatus Pacearchaeota archaeon]
MTVSAQLISIFSSEAVFFSGEPSQTIISVYIPEGVSSIILNNQELVITYLTPSGDNKRSFSSRVNLTGFINNTEGTKNLIIKAGKDSVIISPFYNQ